MEWAENGAKLGAGDSDFSITNTSPTLSSQALQTCQHRQAISPDIYHIKQQEPQLASMASPPNAARQILLVLFPGFNTLDMNGPYEVLAKPGGGDVFKISVASETEITTSAEGVHVKVWYLRD
jgi:hypothetical protein